MLSFLSKRLSCWSESTCVLFVEPTETQRFDQRGEGKLYISGMNTGMQRDTYNRLPQSNELSRIRIISTKNEMLQVAFLLGRVE